MPKSLFFLTLSAYFWPISRCSRTRGCPRSVLPVLLQKLIGDFFLTLGREIWREILCDFPPKKGSKISIFREKICSSKKLFCAKISLCRRATLMQCVKYNSNICLNRFVLIEACIGHIYIYACNFIWWAVLGHQDFMKQHEIRRNKGKKTKKLSVNKPKIQQKPPRFCGGFCWPFFTIKLGIF